MPGLVRIGAVGDLSVGDAWPVLVYVLVDSVTLILASPPTACWQVDEAELNRVARLIPSMRS